MEKKKSRTAKQYSPKQDTPNHTDPLIGWHSLGKESRTTQQSKHGWKRKTRGIGRGDLLALLFVLAMVLFMLMGVSK